MSKILIVDDQTAMRLIISKKIHTVFDVTLVEARGVEEAITHLKAEKFDLVICDYWMDDGTGAIVSQYITEHMMGSTPLIIFSSDNEIVSKYLRDGNHDAILKPNFNGLISTIQKNTSMKYVLKKGIQ